MYSAIAEPGISTPVDAMMTQQANGSGLYVEAEDQM
jgi:hypothetical protein